MNLETKDYELLQFIAANPGRTEEEIFNALSGMVSGIHHRLVVLSISKPPRPGQMLYDGFLDNGNYLICSGGKYRLTSMAYAVLQDWEVKQAEKTRALNEERLGRFLPIAISIAALIVSIYAIYRQP